MINQILAQFPKLAYKRTLLENRIAALKTSEPFAWFQNSWADRCYVKPADRETYRKALHKMQELNK